MSGAAWLSPGSTAVDRQAVPPFANVLNSPLHMNITGARHFLDDKGEMAPSRGPAKAMAGFRGGAIVYATDSMMSASCSRDASSAGRVPSGPNLHRTMPSTGTVPSARPKVASPIGKARSGSSATGQARQAEGGRGTMGYGHRNFIVHDDGTLDRMRNNVFDQLLRDPQHHSMPAMAGKRVRMADIVVQLENRKPVCVVRRVYFVVSFDDEGRLDTKRFLHSNGRL
jgi:hypothetical protein